MLGLFLNTLPLRLQLKDINWLELVKITFKTEMEVWPHRRLPLDEIQKSQLKGSRCLIAYLTLPISIFINPSPGRKI